MILHTSLQELRQNINQDVEPTNDIPYLWVSRDFFLENLPRYNGTALYIQFTIHEINLRIINRT